MSVHLETFGERLRDARGTMSQAELARRICASIPGSGYQDKDVRRWEKDRGYPEARALRAIGAILGVSIDYLFGFTDEPRPPHLPVLPRP